MTGTWRVALAKAVLAALARPSQAAAYGIPTAARPVFEDAAARSGGSHPACGGEPGLRITLLGVD